MQVEGLNHISVTTADLERAKWFYGEVLGLPMRGEGEESSAALDRLVGLDGGRFRWAEYHVGRGQILELLQYLSPEGTPLTQRPCDPGSAHFAFEVRDIDETYARLISAGVTVRSQPVLMEEDDDWRGFRCIYALDTDGFTVEFLQPLSDGADGGPMV
jgi:catechol 2,3-dioxygenase-like lactoylglutathione lyase family enzyme